LYLIWYVTGHRIESILSLKITLQTDR